MPKKKNTVRADGRIAVQVYIGMQDGKRKYKTVYGRTQKEADEKALHVKLSLQKGIDVTAQNETFGYWAEQWLKIKQQSVSDRRYKSCKYKLKYFSDIILYPINKIKTSDIQIIIFDNSNLSSDTLKQIKNMARQIIQLAIDNRVLEYNPVNAVKMPSAKPKSERRALTDEEREWILNTPHKMQTGAMIMLYAGLRRGELLALTWPDIDLINKIITVNKSVEMINGKPTVKMGAKTNAGIRTIDIPNILVDFLRQQPRDNNLLVCHNDSGGLMSDTSWRRRWDSYILELNIKYGNFDRQINYKSNSKYAPQKTPIVIERFTAHCLRHTYATMLYFSGVDILTAKEQLGHADIKTTLEIYTHLDEQFKRNKMNKLNEYLDNASHMQVKVNEK